MKKPSYMGYYMLSAICLMMGVWMAVFGAREAQVSADLASRGVTTEATVVAVEQKSETIEPSGGVRTWTDVTVAFTNAQGTPVRATKAGSESTKVGDRLRIVYDPRDPTHASWDTAVDEGSLDWFYAVMGLAGSLALLAVALRDARRRRRGAIYHGKSKTDKGALTRS